MNDQPEAAATALLEALRDLISQARQQVLRNVDVVQVGRLGGTSLNLSKAGKTGPRMASNC